MDNQAFSKDGYIIDQRFTTEYMYGRFDSSYNGCGWIAAFNLLKALDHPVTSLQVNQEMNAILPRNGMLGTTQRMLIKYLTDKCVPFSLVKGKSKIIKSSSACRAGIIRYIDCDKTPHLVAFAGKRQDSFRFFNSMEGVETDYITLDDFYETRVFAPQTYALLVDDVIR
ncbi:MAG: hypothetical protein EOM18_09580 [Clostridia bacterium]|nr:hypothetical protein [Clostridia bacterium]